MLRMNRLTSLPAAIPTQRPGQHGGVGHGGQIAQAGVGITLILRIRRRRIAPVCPGATPMKTRVSSASSAGSEALAGEARNVPSAAPARAGSRGAGSRDAKTRCVQRKPARTGRTRETWSNPANKPSFEREAGARGIHKARMPRHNNGSSGKRRRQKADSRWLGGIDVRILAIC